MKKMRDIKGERFGMITVIDFARSEPDLKKKRTIYYFTGLCDCGSVKEYKRNYLLEGVHKSCGCLNRICGSSNPSFRGTGEIGSSFWNHIIKGAEKRGLDFSITSQEAWELFVEQDGKCGLSGLPISMHLGRKPRYGPIKGGVIRTASLDRINNDKGYVTGNIMWVHKDINRMKTDFSIDRFKELCRLVSEHQTLS